MGNSTFSGVVRSENGFSSVTKSTTTGVTTTDSTYANNASIGGTLSVSGVSTLSGNSLATTAGVGITGGTGTVYQQSVERVGTLIRTTILLDLTGLNCGASIGDIIGTNGTGAAHLGQITAAVNGTIFAGKMFCYETPAGGDPDINVYSAAEATGVEDTPITSLTETLLVNSGDLVIGTLDAFSAYPAADEYLYLSCGTVTAGTYTAGIVEITLYGY